MPVTLYRSSADEALAPSIAALQDGEYVSPWVDAVRDKQGSWQLPQYPCEIKDLPAKHPKQKSWTPGNYEEGLDNTDLDEHNHIREWGGQKMWEGDRPPRDWDVNRFPEHVQALLRVPHMPGQPVKETFARLKALDPRPFQDKYFEEVLRDMVPEWPAMLRRAKYAESFGLHSEAEPSEWAGQEDELVPAAYPTPRPDTVTICVGVAGYDGRDGPPTVEIAGAEYDFLEFLYARDQEGKLIQIVPFPNYGMSPTAFHTFSFVPPRGTSSITPFACFKIRGAWRGSPIEWDPEVGSDEMQWFTEMAPELRLQLADRTKLQPRSNAQVADVRPPRGEKQLPVLWPENSWEGNAAKARGWDEKGR